MEVIDVLYKRNLVKWETLYYGWKENKVNKKTLINHAIREIDNGNKSDVLFLMAGGDFEDTDVLTEYLNKLVDNNTINLEFENNKWLFGSLIKIAESKADDNEKLQQLQNVFSDFGYPEIMSKCSIYYIPQNNDSNEEIIDPLKEMKKVIHKLETEINCS